MQRKITNEEKKYLSTLKTTNERKDYLQNIQITDLAKRNKVIFQLATGFGKSFLAVKAIKRCKAKFGGSFVVVVPDLRLKASWEDYTKDIGDVYVYVVNSFTMSNVYIPDDVIMTIFDEAHHYANPDSMYFSQAVKKVNAKYQACLSATLNDKQVKYLYTLGFAYKWEITLEDCLRLQLVIPYRIYNIPVEFTNEEKKEYAKLQDEYKNNLYWFEQYLLASNVNINLASVLASALLPKTPYSSGEVKFMGVKYNSYIDLAKTISNVVGVNYGVLLSHAKKWRVYRTKRNNLLHNAENKIKLCDEILKIVHNKKAVVFTNTKLNAEKIVKLNKSKRKGYYSGKDDKTILQDFFDFVYPHLVAIRKVDEGDLDNEVSVGINLTHQSESRRSYQSLGRLLRFDPNDKNKKAIYINIYVEDYELYGKKYISQDKKWLLSSQKEMKFVEYIDNINEINW